MKDLFAAYYRPSELQFKELWEKAVFVLDANVLLNLYRYRKETSSALLQVLSKIQSRLWVPYQAALEYQQNRLSVIAEQLAAFANVSSELNKSLGSLKGSLIGKLQLPTRHASIDVDSFLTEIDKLFSDFSAKLDALKKTQPDITDRDKLRDTIDDLLKERVGQPPKDQDTLNSIYADGKRRFAEKRPPGYADALKEGFYSHAGLSFQRQYGDLVVWEEIIEKAKISDLTHLILLTDDKKEDWWWIQDSQGKKTIGPRPELIDEIRSRTKVSVFYMYTSERFLSYAGQFLGATIKPDTIDEVRAVSLHASERYKEAISSIHPLAIKLYQREVHAPGHESWGTVTCDTCGEKFGLGYNRIYGSGGQTADQCAEALDRILAADHAANRTHLNCVTFDFPTAREAVSADISFPNYQFICPKCGLPISIIWKAPRSRRENVIFALECPRATCGWSGELPASAGRPI